MEADLGNAEAQWLIKKLNQDLWVLNRYLEDEVCEVSNRLHNEEWKVLGLETRLVQMEARQQIMMERLDAMNVKRMREDWVVLSSWLLRLLQRRWIRRRRGLRVVRNYWWCWIVSWLRSSM